MTTWNRAADWRTWTLSELVSLDSKLRFGASGTDFDAKTGLTVSRGNAAQSAIVSADALVFVGSTVNYNGYAIDAISVGDGEIRFRLRAVRADSYSVPEVSFRVTDGSNRYYTSFYESGGAGNLRINRIVADVNTNIAATSFAYTPPFDITVKIVLSGTSITVTDITNTIVATVTDASFSSGGVYVDAGVFGSAGWAAFEWIAELSTATSATGTSPSVNGGSANWRALLEWAEDLSGDGDVTFDVQDSADGTTDWQDVTGLTGLTDPAGKVFTVPRQYARVIANFSRSTTSQEPIVQAVTLEATSIALNGAGRGVMRGM